MDLEFALALARRANSYAATKSAEVLEIFTARGGSFKGGGVLTRSRTDSVMFPNVIKEGMRPETSVEIGSSEFGT
jgi:hypothetical protein